MLFILDDQIFYTLAFVKLLVKKQCHLRQNVNNRESIWNSDSHFKY